jgi:integrase
VYPNGHYELRYYEGTKAVYKNVGYHLGDAEEAQKQTANALLAEAHAREAGGTFVRSEAEKPKHTKTLKELYDRFLGIKGLESVDTGSLYRLTLSEFILVANKIYPEEIETDDIAHYCAQVQRRLSARTRSNRFTALMTFFKFCVRNGAKMNLDILVQKEDRRRWKKHVKHEPESYAPEEVEKLIAASNQYYALIWDFLWKTGFREKEAEYLEWSDIDFQNFTVSVRHKPNMGLSPKGRQMKFVPKGRQERSVPLVKDLAEKLKAWRERHPRSRFIFGTKSDLPNGHWLHRLKKIAAKAGMNCGKCKTCRERNECENFYLHKFRASYATRLLRAGLDIVSVQKLLGHADVATTMRYLSTASNAYVAGKVEAALSAA